MSARAGTMTTAPMGAMSRPPGGPWIYTPWLDLAVGCGAWSAPLLLVTAWLRPAHAHPWVVGFYFLAIVFNYPHFMATIYRAYRTHEEFQKYKFFTLHLTLLLAITGVLLHASYRLLPWVFTLYIYWSPWHYAGQNYGLLQMFVKRSGASLTPTQGRWLRAAFIASYVMLLASFQTGGSSDPLILSLGLSEKFTIPLRIALGGAFAFCAWFSLHDTVRRDGFGRMIAPLTLLLTQFLWFVLPTLVEIRASIPQTRYSSGILAVLHSAQYLWITSYYQRRDALAEGKSNWHVAGYFAVLIAGGIALFIPGPWIVSYLFRFDFTTSFLIFTALVNIHHFLLDGAIWKLRDSRIASMLISASEGATARQAPREGGATSVENRGRVRRLVPAPAFRAAVIGLLFLWGAADQVHFDWGTSEQHLPSLLRAASMNPYDSAVLARVGAVEEGAGQSDRAIETLEQAAKLNPHNAALQQACARAMIAAGRYQDAYAWYHGMLEVFPKDSDALMNYGLLAAQLNHPEEAIGAWEKAVEADPARVDAHLYLAQAAEQNGQLAAAERHWRSYLAATTDRMGPAMAARARIPAVIRLADDEARLNQSGAAQTDYSSAIALAEAADDPKLESLASAHMADAREKAGDAPGAADFYQRTLALDAKAGDPKSEGADWFNYGQFLRRRGKPDDLAYACFIHAETLLSGIGGPELEMTQQARRETGARLGKRAADVDERLPVLLAGATSLPPASFR